MSDAPRRFSLRRIPIALIHLYQKHSANTPPVCRFSPTCSAYAVEAYQRHGIWIGTGLALWRILRCNPLFRGGYDPVPERISWPGARRRRPREEKTPRKKSH